METIDQFDGKYAFLSNFYHSPILHEGWEWDTVEHLYQAQKTVDIKLREAVWIAETPALAKRIARKQPLRGNWELIKKRVMLDCLRKKFRQNHQLCAELLKTGDAILIEGNYWHDNTWGNCTCVKCKYVEGTNLLGILLMQARMELSF